MLWEEEPALNTKMNEMFRANSETFIKLHWSFKFTRLQDSFAMTDNMSHIKHCSVI